MSGKKIVGIILIILGLIGAYYYIGGYFQVKSQFGNVFGVADETLKNYWPMMAASIAVLILGAFLIFKGDEQPSISNNSNSTAIQTSSPTSQNFYGDKSLANDSYKIFLVKKYGIEKNEALGKIICQGKLFDDTEQALQHAAEIDGATLQPSNQSGVANLTEVQKALATDTYKQPPMLSDEARKFGITHNGLKYCYKTYQYDELDDALKFARNDVQAASTTKQDKSPSSNKMIIAVAVGVIAIIGGYFALQKNSCSDAKADVIKYMQIYANALYQGKQGMSVPGASEAIAALEIAKKACNKPDLTVEEILNPQAATPKSQPTQQSNTQAPSNPASYKTKRDKLLKEGWRPLAQTEECSSSCQKWRNAGWIETESCAPTGVVPCIFVFKNQNGSLLKVYTEGEEDPWVVNMENSSSSQVSPSFDCSKAKSTSEKLICSDSQLANEDNQLSALYKSAKLKAKDPAAFKAMTTAAWKEREANCFDKACLLKWYASRKVVYQNIINGTQ